MVSQYYTFIIIIIIIIVILINDWKDWKQKAFLGWTNSSLSFYKVSCPDTHEIQTFY